ncbi:MAG: hypothetical protein HYU56_00230 [Candidatus Aenigmarchaeota archaeon]|nr:hypothetical protein [Candidatus Aenigmarchaeota archaeon]
MNRKTKITVSALALAASLGTGTVAVGNLASVERQLARNSDYARYLTLRETRGILSKAKEELTYEKGSGGVGVGLGINPGGNPGLGLYTGTGGSGIGVGYVFSEDNSLPGPAVYATMPEPDKFPDPAKAKELIGEALNRLGKETGIESGLKVVQESLPNERKESAKSPDNSMFRKHLEGVDTAIRQIELRENAYSGSFSDLQNKQALNSFLLAVSITGSVGAVLFGMLYRTE